MRKNMQRVTVEVCLININNVVSVDKVCTFLSVKVVVALS